MFFKRASDKIKRSDIVDHIITLESQQNEILAQIENNKQEYEKYFVLGKAEKDRNIQMIYAKKIEIIKKENLSASKQMQFIMANTKALYQLKDALDDREFIKNSSTMPLNKLLTNHAELNKLMSKVVGDKRVYEDKLGETLDIFNEFEDLEENQKIYGASESQSDILAMFDMENAKEDITMFEKTEDKKMKTIGDE